MLRRLAETFARRYGGRQVAIVRMSGTIVEQSVQRPNHINLERYNVCLTSAFASNPRAVALQINSPGGSPVQSSLIVKRVRQLKEKYGKIYDREIPVVAFLEDSALSGGYYLACAADTIVCEESSLVGSIGVIVSSFGLQGLADKVGLERRVYTAGSNKNQLDPFLPEDPAQIEKVKATLNGMHEIFIDVVKKSRKDRLRAPDDELFNGDFFHGKRAQELGLADEVSSLHDYCQREYGDKVGFRFFRPRTAFPQLF
ncbi:Protease 4 [Hondaea fermentalgiana]|uniref:Protease 4 n=1 Tax=Hondaea fermentalgiana TaxID=2315210 RepID=A0A2R5GX14_9STRA|nr:Protease 4 [Hondaea fermentalgiana]|eukprot:GBG33223.1 Protease 4 [Hondaea fermentalgiana]